MTARQHWTAQKVSADLLEPAARRAFNVQLTRAAAAIPYDLADLNDLALTTLADGDALVYDLATKRWKNAAGGGAHALLSATHSDTLAATVVRGDLIVGNATPKWARLALGASGKYLRTNGTDASWQALSASDLGAGNVPWAQMPSGGGTWTLAGAVDAVANITGGGRMELRVTSTAANAAFFVVNNGNATREWLGLNLLRNGADTWLVGMNATDETLIFWQGGANLLASLTTAGTFAAVAFSGPLTGNVTGNVSGSSGSCTGNAATVTGLAVTAGQTLTVTTGGTLGSAAYTASTAYDVAGAAAAITLAGLGGLAAAATTLPASFLASSLTSVGALASGSIVAGFGGAVFGGAVTFGTDNIYDIGAAGATRPRTGYFGTSVVAPLFGTVTPDNVVIQRNGVTRLTVTGTTSTFASGAGFAGSVVVAGSVIVTTAAGNHFLGYSTADDSVGVQFFGIKARVAGTGAVWFGDTLFRFSGRGQYDTGLTSGDQVSVYFVASENWSATNRGTKVLVRQTPLGSTAMATFWTFDSAGLMAFTDNTLDIGAAGATRPRTGYFGTSVISPLVSATTRVTSPLVGTTSAVDVVFDRNSVTQLTLGSRLATFAGDIAVTTHLRTGDSAAATVGVGSLAKKLPLYDLAGSLLGYVPVYASIT